MPAMLHTRAFEITVAYSLSLAGIHMDTESGRKTAVPVGGGKKRAGCHYNKTMDF